MSVSPPNPLKKPGFYISEVWLVDINEQCLEVYRDPTPTGYGTVEKLQRGEVVSISRIPGLNIQVDEILG